MAKESTMQPFEKGDVFAGATLLNNPDDDHAGPGRIFQFDSDLNEKGILWVEGTSHLIGGLKFGPDGNLWAFDSHAYKVIRVSPEGKQLPDIDFPQRSLSNVNFGPDGSLYFGEHLVGDKVELPPERPLGTTLRKMPNSDRFGDGHVFKCNTDGELIREYATATNGGMPGFLGVTCSTLAADGKTLLYLSELGPQVFRYDLEADRQLPDFIHFEQGSGDIAMYISYGRDGTLFFITANFPKKFFALQTLDENGQPIRTYTLEERGWASVAPSIDGKNVFLGNFFTGQVAKFDLDSGDKIATAETNVERGLAGCAQYPG